MSGLLTDLVGGLLERREVGPSAPRGGFFPDFIHDILGNAFGDGTAEAFTNSTSALSLSAVWACVRCITEDCAKIPVQVVRRVGDNVYEPVDHPLNYLLNVSPDDEMDAFNFRVAILQHALLQGNGVAFPTFGKNGYVKRIRLALPEQVTLRRDTQSRALLYDHTGDTKITRDIPAHLVIHIMGPTRDGLTGLSVVQTAGKSWAMAKYAQEFGSTFFANSARPSGILTFKGKPNEEQKKRILASWQEGSSGKKLGRTAMVWDDAEYHQLTMPLEDAQFIETMQATKPDICSWFRVPPHKVQDYTKSNNATNEQAELRYVTDALMPWFVRFEQASARKCLERGLELMHVDDELVRGDFKTTQEGYAIQRQWGLRTINELRRRDGLKPVEGGDKIFVPANQITIDNAVKQTQDQGQAQPAQDGDAANIAEIGKRSLATLDRAILASRPLFEECAERLLKIEEDRTARIAKDQDPVRRERLLGEFRAAHLLGVRGHLGGLTDFIAQMVGGPLEGRGVRLAATLADAWMAMPAPTPEARSTAARARTDELARTLRTAAVVMINEGDAHAPRSSNEAA